MWEAIVTTTEVKNLFDDPIHHFQVALDIKHGYTDLGFAPPVIAREVLTYKLNVII